MSARGPWAPHQHSTGQWSVVRPLALERRGFGAYLAPSMPLLTKRAATTLANKVNAAIAKATQESSEGSKT